MLCILKINFWQSHIFVLNYLTIVMLYPPFALSAFWDDNKVKRCSIRKHVLILGVDDDRISRGAHGLESTGQLRAVVVKIFHVNGNRTSGCFIRLICV